MLGSSAALPADASDCDGGPCTPSAAPRGPSSLRPRPQDVFAVSPPQQQQLVSALSEVESSSGDRRHRDASAVLPFIGLTSSSEQSRSCCQNGGTCILGSFCACPQFFTGRTCEYDLRLRSCGPVPHGQCVCVCVSGAVGRCLMDRAVGRCLMDSVCVCFRSCGPVPHGLSVCVFQELWAGASWTVCVCVSGAVGRCLMDRAVGRCLMDSVCVSGAVGRCLMDSVCVCVFQELWAGASWTELWAGASWTVCVCVSGAVGRCLMDSGYRKAARTVAVVMEFCTASLTSFTRTVKTQTRFDGSDLEAGSFICRFSLCSFSIRSSCGHYDGLTLLCRHSLSARPVDAMMDSTSSADTLSSTDTLSLQTLSLYRHSLSAPPVDTMMD
ncbi:hypothetical protein WMY93_021090 [Mugilogobius chulae]|uniref:EGF-like domain-containing protein n=1 Tax=Mugilogobius chulae TaxID=88201 RepID=A0AAW0NCV3_9GOBI